MKRLALVSIGALGLFALGMGYCQANPQGGQVAAGSAAINTVPGTVTINQASNTAIINWQSFSIGAGELTKFVQPSSTSAALNRVIGGQTSMINGTLSANGQVYLINGNGIVVGPGGLINAAGFVASTRDISNADFLSGNLHFAGNSDAGVQNLGTINAVGGNVYLIGQTVDNQGTINAPGATVGLASADDVLLAQQNSDGNTVTVNPVAAPSTTSGALTGVHNSGTITAASAELKAANGNIYALAINNEGVVRATTVTQQGGHIYLTSDTGTVVNAGTLDASATVARGAGGTIVVKNMGGQTVQSGKILARGGQGGAGGKIETSGKSVQIGGTVDAGEGGEWLLDPASVTIDSSNVGTYEAALNGGTDTTVTSSGDIDVNAALTWSAAADLTLTAYSNVNVAANISNTSGGSSEKITLQADNSGTGTGSVYFSNGAQISTAGKVSIFYNPSDNPAGSVINSTSYSTPDSFSGDVTGGATLKAYMLVNTVDDLQNMQNNLGGDYALGRNIDASSTSTWNSGDGFVPIGNSTTPFNGIFNGQDYSIDSLTITTPNSDNVGLFGVTGSGAILKNVSLTNVSVFGSDFVGGLAGTNQGTINNASVSGTLTVDSNGGGLVGNNNGGTISNSSSAGTVTALGAFNLFVGGLVGDNTGAISGSHSDSAVNVSNQSQYVGGLAGWNDINGGSIDSSYSTGAVNAGTGSSYVGGLVGGNIHTLSNSYSLSSVNVSGNALYVGGLIGYNNATVSNSYSTGSVGAGSSSSDVGGLAGYNSAQISNDYSTSSVSISNGNGTGEGGLVGYNDTGGAIANSYSTGSVLSIGGYANSGGLVGVNDGSINTSYSSSTVSGNGAVGGLVGYNPTGSIMDAYSTGAVTGGNAVGGAIGGLVGYNVSGTIYNTYSSGPVSGTSLNVGGLAGANGGTISDSFWDTTTSGMSTSQGGIGNTTSNLMSLGNYSSASWDIGTDVTPVTGNTWVIFDGQTRPMLAMEYSQTITNAHQLQLIGLNSTTANASYTLASNIDLSSITNPSDVWGTSTTNGGAGFVPIGNSPSGLNFSGTFNGQGYGISYLYINAPTAAYIGLFGVIGPGTVENVGVLKVQVTGNSQVGALAGVNNGGTILNAFSTGTVNLVGSGAFNVGGLVGSGGGSITDAYSAATVNAANGSFNIGGLVGQNNGVISSSYSSGTVTGGTGTSKLGGLVGWNYPGGTISDAYSTASVSAGSSSYIGGLVGINDVGSTISDAYSSGFVSANSSSVVGGLVGDNEGAVQSSFWDTSTSGFDSSSGFGIQNASANQVSGLATSSLMSLSTYTTAGWDFGTNGTDLSHTWVIFDGQTRPMLSMEYSTTITNAHQLQLIDLNPTTVAANYILAKNVNLSGVINPSDVWGTSTTNGGAGFVSIGSGDQGVFTGTFNGQGNVVKNLYINVGGRNNVGLFAINGMGATIENVGLTNAQVISEPSNSTGALVGYNFGTVSNAYSTGTVTAAVSSYNTGGLVGYNDPNGTINNSYSTAVVSGNHDVGGLVGANYGTINNAYSVVGTVTGVIAVGGLVGDNVSGAINNAYSTETVNGSGGSYVGGLAGENESGSISNVYAGGAVSGGGYVGGLLGYNNTGVINNAYSTGSVYGTTYDVGGLVGLNGGTINDTYSSGAVTILAGGSDVGGLMGVNTGTISSSFWDTNTTGVTLGVGSDLTNTTPGVTGETTSDLLSLSTYAGWDFGGSGGTLNGTWVIFNGQTRPMLSMEYSTTITDAHQLQLIGLNSTTLSSNYTLANNIDLGGTSNPSDVWGTSTTNSGAGFVPIGNGITYYDGTFNGQGYTINGLYINTPNTNNVGLFAQTGPGATVEDVSLTGVQVSGNQNVGGLVGQNNSGATISGASSTGSVTGGSTSQNVGGLVGGNLGTINNYSFSEGTVFGDHAVGGLVGVNQATIDHSSSAATVTSDDGSNQIGGLVGLNLNSGTISNSYSSGSITIGGGGHNGGGLAGENDGTISTSYSSSTVFGQGGNEDLGGLVGYNSGTGSITDTYATGSVGPDGAFNIGGLVGQNDGSINNSYSSGNVTGSSNQHAGGIVGYNTSTGSINNSFWDTNTSGQDSDSAFGQNDGSFSNVNGNPTTGLLSESTYSYVGWNIATDLGSTWVIFDGRTRPMLSMEYGTVIGNAHELQLAAMAPGASYTLSSNLDLSVVTNPSEIWGTSTSNGGAGFVPIGNGTTSFTGTFNGQGYKISSLYINQPNGTDIGLFGANGGTVENLGVTDVNVSGYGYVGGLVGGNSGTINNDYSTGTVGITGSGGYEAGGLVGINFYGTINNSYSSATVTSTGNAFGTVGGLVGYNDVGTISNSYSSGSVTVQSGNYVGGLVGQNNDTINNSYSTGSVTLVGEGSDVGGLVGYNQGTINNVYSSGAVSGSSQAGGLIGDNEGTINNSFWDTCTSGFDSSSGFGVQNGTLNNVNGLVTSNLLSESTYSDAGWNIGTDLNNNTWVIFDGQTRPMLSMEYSTTITNGHQMQLIGLNATTLAANYTLAPNDSSGNGGSITNPSNIWGTSTTNGGAGCVPIGNGTTPFTGTFNGEGATLSNIYINTPSANDVGLFGATASTAVIQNLTLDSVNVTGNDAVGGVVGDNAGYISGVSSTGIVSATYQSAGGLAGTNEGTITNGSSSANVSGGSGSYNIGGLVGYNDGTISSMGAMGTVSGTYGIGGLVGWNNVNGTISNSSGSGAVTGDAVSVDVGGLVGRNDGTINSASAAGAVHGFTSVGGLVGLNYGTITQTQATGNISSNNGSSIGGLVGQNGDTTHLSPTISYSDATGNVSGGNLMGGLAGVNYGGISYTNATGAVTDTTSPSGSLKLGGLVGYDDGSISYSLATGNVTGNSTAEGGLTILGGLVGYLDGSISNVRASGAVTGSEAGGVGGLVGYSKGSITLSYATGAVTGPSDVGGLVGFDDASAGYLLGAISSSYASGAVSGNDATTTGGLVGNLVYDVVVSPPSTTPPSITNSYWDRTTTGQNAAFGSNFNSASFPTVASVGSNGAYSNSSYGNLGTWTQIGTTNEYEVLNGSTVVWFMIDGNTRPFLGSEYSTNITNAHQLQLMDLNLTASYTLGNNISMSELTDASGVWNSATGFVPIGSGVGFNGNFYATSQTYTNGFTGNFNGQGYAIDGLYINNTNSDSNYQWSGANSAHDGYFEGLFAVISNPASVVQNVGLTNVQINGDTLVGSIAGVNYGTIQNSYATGSINDVGGGPGNGGLVGQNGDNNHQSLITGSYSAVNLSNGTSDMGGLAGVDYSGNISNSYNTGSVSTQNGSTNIGGLVGINFYGLITNSYNTGAVSGTTAVGGLVGYNFANQTFYNLNGDYNSGAVTGSVSVGGIAGENDSAWIINVYNTGSVNSYGGATNLGGVAGVNHYGKIVDSYSSGAINIGSGSSGIGGLVGYTTNSSISNSFWDTTTSGTTLGIGSVGSSSSVSNVYGLTTPDLMSVSTYLGQNTSTSGAVVTLNSDGSYHSTQGSNTDISFANGWDINSSDLSQHTWVIFDGQTRPMLSMEWSTTITNAHQLQLVGFNSLTLQSNYTLANNIDLSGINNSSDIWGEGSDSGGPSFVPIGYSGNNYVGTFNGNGYTINNLYINSIFSGDSAGLFGNSSGTIENVGLTNVQVTGGGYGANVGGLVGTNNGTITNSYVTGSVTGNEYNANVGGLVGSSYGTINNSYSTAAVYGFNGSYSLGGLVGYAGGTINNVYSSGAVNGDSGSNNVGGLVGLNAGGTISNAYSLGAVTGGNTVGGFVGFNNGTINNAYSSGPVSGSYSVGGFAGTNVSPGGGVINASFWDDSTAGQSYALGSGSSSPITGGSATDESDNLLSLNTYNNAGWNIGTDPTSNTWVILDGQTRPMLGMEYSTTITNAHQLQLVGLNSTTLGASYTVANDIDLSGITNASEVWSTSNGSGAGFAPIGTNGAAFTGTFNGQNNLISSLYINAPNTNYIGLFGETAASASILDVTLSGANISGNQYVGALVGYNYGTVDGDDQYTNSRNGLTDSQVIGLEQVGGVVGENDGTIINTGFGAHVDDEVGGYEIGGLVGANTGQITNSGVSGTVTGESASVSVGGLVGFNNGTINNSGAGISGTSVMMTVNGISATSVGGLVGLNDGTISNSTAYSTVTGDSLTVNVGGVAGGNDGTISYSSSDLAVTGVNAVGGIAGYNNNTIYHSHNYGTITGIDSSLSVGGVVGYNEPNGTINHSQNDGMVTTDSSSHNTGGLVGDNAGTITNGSNNNDAIISGNSQVGGLVGQNESTGSIMEAGNFGVVSGSGNVGGLVGYNNGGSVSISYNSGLVATTAIDVGGLVGFNTGTITNVYNTGEVNGNYNVGGLVGYNFSGTISNTYSSGLVVGNTNVGGLVGYTSGGSVSNSFWDTATSGQGGSSGIGANFSTVTNVNGLTTSDLLNESTYANAGWNIGNNVTPGIGNTWVILDGQTRPMLAAEWGTDIKNAHQLQLASLDPSANYTLANDIDLSSVTNPSEVWGTSTTNGGGGFVPIGNAEAFTGTFDGQGNVINGLYINTPGASNVGLFGYVGSGATIQNVALTNVNVTGYTNVGGLVGTNEGGTITQDYSSGTVVGNGWNIGGLVGYNNGAISNVYSLATVTGLGTQPYNGSVGGLVGINDYNGTVDSTYSTGAVAGNSSVGGLVGFNNGSVSNSFWDTNTSGQGSGSGIGAQEGTILNVNGLPTGTLLDESTYLSVGWDVSTNDLSSAWVMGDMQTRPVLSMEYSTTITNAHQLQLIAVNQTTRSASYTLANSIDASGTGNPADVWGSSEVLNSNRSLNIAQSYGAGFVPISNYPSSGFTGTFDGQGYTINGLFINTPGDNAVGLFGLVGSGASIRNVGLTNVYVSGNQEVGGLAGDVASSASIYNTYTTGRVVGATGGFNTGGLVGLLESGASISNSYSSASVYGDGAVGGLVGQSLGSIYASYSTGSADGNDTVGGLVGNNIGSGSIDNAYSTEPVNGTLNVGGLIGNNTGSINASFWDTTTSGANVGIGSTEAGSSVANVFGLTTPDLLNFATYNGTNTSTAGAVITLTSTGLSNAATGPNQNIAFSPGWSIDTEDLNATWIISDGVGEVRPFLTSEYSTTITNAHQLQLIAVDAATLSAHYTVANNIDASGTGIPTDLWGSKEVLNGDGTLNTALSSGVGFTPIGEDPSVESNGPAFTGTFSGHGYTISGLFINLPNTDAPDNYNVGLFGFTGAGSIIKNVNLTNVQVSGYHGVGGLVGTNEGLILKDFVSGAVSGGNYVGGLVGYNEYATYLSSSSATVSNGNYMGGLAGGNGGTIADSFSTGEVDNGGSFVGGLVGQNFGQSIINSFSTGTVNGSYQVGGLVGLNSGPIMNVYSTGAVNGNSDVGGLVGDNSSAITSAYSTGAVSGSSNVGGFLGQNENGGTVSDSFWATDTSGIGYGIASDNSGLAQNLTGGTTTQLQTQSFILNNLADSSSWDFTPGTGTWGSNGLIGTRTGPNQVNNGLPYFQWQYATPISLAVNDQSVVYGSSIDSTQYTIDAGSANTSSYLVSNAISVGGGVAVTSDVGTYTGVLNLNFTPYAGVTVEQSQAVADETITPLALTVTGVSASKVYNGATSTTLDLSGASLQGVLFSDDVSADPASAYTANFATPNVGSGIAVTVASLGLTGAKAEDYTLTQPTNVTGNITRASITISTSNVTKTYDGSDSALGTATVSSGTLFFNVGDSTQDSISGGTFAFTNPNAGTGNKSVGVSGVTVNDNNGGGNYTVSYVNNTTSTINSALLTISTSNVTKTYDGTDTALGTATVSSGTLFFNVGDSTQDSISGGTFAFTNPNAGTGNKTVAVSGVTVNDNNGGGNYTVSYVNNTTSTINKALLALTTSNVTKTYDGTDTALGTATVSSGTLFFNVGDSTQDSISGGTFAFTNPNAGTGNKSVAVSGVTVNDNNGGGNYTVSYVNNTTSTINKALLALTTSNVTKTYDGTDTALGTATVSSGTLFFNVGDSTQDSISGGTFAFTNPNAGTGNKTVSVSGVTVNDNNGGGNYTVSYVNTTTSTINKALLALTTSNVTKTYDGSDSALGTATVSSGSLFFNVGDSTQDSISGGTFAFTNPNAGTGNKTVAVSGVTVNDNNGGGNYTVSYVNNTTSTINKALLALTTSNVTKTYDGTDTALGTATVSSGTLFFNVGDSTQDSISGGTFAFTNPNAGTGNKTVTVSGVTVNDNNGGGNYTVSYVNNTTSTINKALLALTTSNVTKTYDGSDSALGTATVSSGSLFFNVGDSTQDSISGGTFAFTNPNAGTGNKTVSVSGVTVNDNNGGGNYTVSYVNNTTSTINSALLTISTSNVTKTYDGTDTALGTATVSSGSLFFNVGDSTQDSISGGTFAFTNPNAGTGNKSVAVSGVTVNDNNGGGNYTVSYVNNTTSTINKALLALTTSNVTKTYDGTDTALGTATVSSGTLFFNVGDSTQDSISGGTFAFTNPNAGTGNKTVAVSGVTVNDNNGGGNYTVSYVNNTTSTINSATVTASLVGTVSKVYDTTTAINTLTDANYSLSGVIGSDSVGLGATSLGQYNDANVGTGKTVTVTGLTISNANYQLASTSASGTIGIITPATITVTLTGTVSKTYDSTTAATLVNGNYMVGGVLGSDVVSLSAPSSGLYNSANVGTGINVAVTGLSITNTNYQLAASSLNANIGAITPASLTITGVVANSKVYDGTTVAPVDLSGSSLVGVFPSDTAAVTIDDNASTANFAAKNVGNGIAVTVNLALGGAASGNYTLTQPTGLAANITPAPLYISADDQTISLGSSIPPLTATGIGLAPSDSNSIITGLTTTANSGSSQGDYVIDASLASAGSNYTVTGYSDGTLTIAPASNSSTMTSSSTDSQVQQAISTSNTINDAITSSVIGTTTTTTTGGTTGGTTPNTGDSSGGAINNGDTSTTGDNGDIASGSSTDKGKNKNGTGGGTTGTASGPTAPLQIVTAGSGIVGIGGAGVSVVQPPPLVAQKFEIIFNSDSQSTLHDAAFGSP